MQLLENTKVNEEQSLALSRNALEKWGVAAERGYQPVPHALFRFQKELGLSNAELVTLLNILDFWWDATKNPFPSAATLAKRMNTNTRSVQRHLKVLHEKGYAVRKHEIGKTKSDEPWGFNLEGLVKRLSQLVADEKLIHRKEFRGTVSSK